MKLNLFRFNQVLLPLSFVALAVFTGNLQASAEDPNSMDSSPIDQAEISLERIQYKTSRLSVAQIASRVIDPIPGEVPTSATELTRGKATSLTVAQTITTPDTAMPANSGAETLAPSGSVIAPSTTPNPDANSIQTPVESTPQTIQQPTTQPIIPGEPSRPGAAAQSITEVSPGRATRLGSSYIGVGGNIGIGSGDTALGEGSFAVLSKIGLLPSVSVRPSFLFSDDLTIRLPVTYDFSFGEGPTGGLGFAAAPYVGIGAAISTGDDSNVALLLTGGVDVPLSSQFTATASVNATVTGEAAIGILLGIGYNFQGF